MVETKYTLETNRQTILSTLIYEKIALSFGDIKFKTKLSDRVVARELKILVVDLGLVEKTDAGYKINKSAKIVEYNDYLKKLALSVHGDEDIYHIDDFIKVAKHDEQEHDFSFSADFVCASSPGYDPLILKMCKDSPAWDEVASLFQAIGVQRALTIVSNQVENNEIPESEAVSKFVEIINQPYKMVLSANIPLTRDDIK